jgi:predicted transcriptional regulator of viral defense system
MYTVMTPNSVFFVEINVMDKLTAITTLDEFSRNGRYVFHLHDFDKIFPDESPRGLKASLERLVRSNILTRAVQGVYVYNRATKDSYILEHIVKTMRRGEYNYVSLESALSQYGVISQIPMDRLTVMTTGRSGEYKTPWGVIELTHTERSVSSILEGTIETKSPIKFAKKETAVRDLRRVGRNTHLIDNTELENV